MFFVSWARYRPRREVNSRDRQQQAGQSPLRHRSVAAGGWVTCIPRPEREDRQRHTASAPRPRATGGRGRPPATRTRLDFAESFRLYPAHPKGTGD